MTVICNPIYSSHRSSHSHSLSPSTEKNRVLPAPNQPIAKKMGGDISVLDQNILYICNKMHSLKTKLSPKEFIHAFVISAEPKVSYLRRHWAQPKGINSTMALQEAIKILQSEEPPRGNYPVGGFHSSASVNQDFFTLEEKEAHSTQLVKHMPFLYKTLMGILNPNNMVFPVEPEESPSSKNNNPEGAAREDIPEDIASIAYEDSHQGPEGHHRRLETVVKTICAMVAFSRNRRNNGLQLHNAVRFFSCGISKRVQEYMNYIGLSSSRRTAVSGLKTLAKEQSKKLKSIMAKSSNLLIRPTICIDNIDMEERVHQISIGHRTHTFRGTWGYMHLPDQKLLATLDPSELTISAYHQSLEQVKSMELNPTMFLPTLPEQEHDKKVWKSQIAKVLKEQIAESTNEDLSIPTSPPEIEVISHAAPDLHMLKLMDAFDNSDEGIGQVFESIIQQTGLTGDQFFAQLQPMDGDLATIQNFNCLRNQRAPSSVPEYCINNIVFQLGASHTLWNISSAIFSHHIGDPSNMLDCGAWQHLEALGFAAHKAIQKKDFTLMVNQMERIFEALLCYCLMVKLDLNLGKLGEERLKLPADRWNSTVDEVYDSYCTSRARRDAVEAKNTKLSNTLLLLHDFSTVVEAKRSMKAGDVGRLIPTSGLHPTSVYEEVSPK
ncbi:hypothetical protein PCASD_13192 [Puccinia coronata f. sp. avenae]|uniref:DUF6589 domain-containing protein n=1 Tax=Puccinia coronata f. sp. avenae TaxID=200324 RepID=A0A2N5T2L3_9BASI|nr:hypothetical protein PCASD_13192 [Puccinia coronata f. sp. avenae]